MQIFFEKNNIQTRTIFTGNILKQPVMKNRFFKKHPKCDKEKIKNAAVLVSRDHPEMLRYMMKNYQSYFDIKTLNSAFRNACLQANFDDMRFLSSINGVTPTPKNGNLDDSALFSSVHSQNIDTLKLLEEFYIYPFLNF